MYYMLTTSHTPLHLLNIEQKSEKRFHKKLEKYNLFSNESKTEEGEAPGRRPPPNPPPPPLEDPGPHILWSELDWLIPPKMPQSPHTITSNYWARN